MRYSKGHNSESSSILKSNSASKEQPGPFDVLVLGSGVAGLSTVLHLAGEWSTKSKLSVGILTKGELSQSATLWAQGGVAAVLSGDEDSTDLHLSDTLDAGANLCDEDAVRVLVDEGPDRVYELIRMGANFDRESSGVLSLAREGGHSHARVVHAGGAATGAEVERALVEATWQTASAVLERWFALDLLIEGGRCCGVLALSPAGTPVEIRADHTVLSTGGAGQMYWVTTNPAEATGDGIAMALRAGVAVADIEFVQFHPTALHHPAMPRPLLSEALRGHGAKLRDSSGERFVDELAPRDVVSRTMAARMQEQGVDHLWLDATGLDNFDQRFPNISASLTAIGLDPRVDWLPIAPAAHHLSGGVVTDLWGASTLRGLWAAGEVACTGVHGANRLASNSLLEGMVFGARLAERIVAGKDGAEASGVMKSLLLPHDLDDPHGSDGPDGSHGSHDLHDPHGSDRPHGDAQIYALAVSQKTITPYLKENLSSSQDVEMKFTDLVGRETSPHATLDAFDVGKLRELLQRSMTSQAGVIRSASSLASAHSTLHQIAAALISLTGRDGGVRTPLNCELENLLMIADALLISAELRHESRGAHARSDFETVDDAWRCRLVHNITNNDKIAAADSVLSMSTTRVERQC